MVKKVIKKIHNLYDTGAFHIIIGTFLTKFVALFGSVVVVRLLTKTDYGKLSYIENIYSYAYIFAGIGLSFSALRHIVLAEKIEEKKAIFDYILKHSVIRNSLIYGIVLIVNIFFPYPKGYEDARLWIPILSILVIFQDMVRDVLNTIRAFFANKLYALLSIIVTTGLIIGRIIGAKYAGMGGVLISRILINGIFAFCGVLLVRHVFFGKVNSEPLNNKLTADMNKYSLQNMINDGIWALFLLNDTMIISMFITDPAILADYKVASVFPANVSIFATAIGTFVSPYFTQHENDIEWINNNHKKVTLITMAIIGLVVLGLAVLAKPLISMVYGKTYLNTAGLMRGLLIVAFFNSGMRYTTANILAALGDAKVNVYVSAIGVISQILLDFMLIPMIGINGVVVSNAAVYLIMALILLIYFKRSYSKQ